MKSTALKNVFSPTQEYEIFVQICTLLKEWNIPSVASAAEVCPATIYNWMDGTTVTPRLDTIVKVAQAIGYELTLTPIDQKPQLRIVK